MGTDYDERGSGSVRDWRRAGIALAVLLALLTAGAWLTSPRGEQSAVRHLTVVHENY
jgi:hypothetical protein